MMANQLQRFLSVKLHEELLMCTELETNGEKTATVKLEELSSPVTGVDVFKEVGIELGTF